jgi:protein TonB
MRWSMVPVSVAAHAAVFVALLILPLTASVELPTPAPIWKTPEFIQATALPPEPSPAQPVLRTNREAAPTRAPERIEPEDDEPVIPPGPPGPPGSIATDPGLPTGSGEPGVNIGNPVNPPPPPPPPQKPAPVRASSLIRQPIKIVDVQPVYPAHARAARIEGLVIIEAIIDERGHVTNARVLRSAPLLDEAALTAVRQWRYTPTLLNNVPVSVIMTITFNFKLGSDTP